MRIRRAITSDSAFISDVYRPFVESHWASFETVAPSPDDIRRRIDAAGERYPWLIAEEDEPLGYAYASEHRSRVAYQTSIDVTIYLAPAARGRGIGRRLYLELLRVAAAQNYVMAFAGIALPNDASIALHRSVGFEPIGEYRNVGFKHGSWRSTLWMGRALACPGEVPRSILAVRDVFPSKQEPTPN